MTLNEREHGHIAVSRRSRPPPPYDLTFSPVKSVSALTGVGPSPGGGGDRVGASQPRSRTLRRKTTLFTQASTDGVRQVEINGLVGTAFTHRDGLTGDPDLHTHRQV